LFGHATAAAVEKTKRKTTAARACKDSEEEKSRKDGRGMEER
jgi:hypothetical protein